MKSEFESRISFSSYKDRFGRKLITANVYWNGKSYETIKATKELCIADLERKVGVAHGEDI